MTQNPDFKLPFPDNLLRSIDPFGIIPALSEVQQAWLQQPQKFAERLEQLAEDLTTLNCQYVAGLAGIHLDNYEPASDDDGRFQDEIWRELPNYDFLKELYLIQTHWIDDLILEAPGLSDKVRRNAAFWVSQGLNAFAPSNYYWTNPLAIWRSVVTGGDSLRKGIQLLADDLNNSDISMVGRDSFQVGVDVANTPGSVVFRNEMLELIQYHPTTDKVKAIPLLIVAPWINKYYILDINERKSLVRYLTSKGFSVFITSWKNPDESLRESSYEDYMFKGILEAMQAVLEITGQQQMHAIGYCIGGTTLSALMAWLNRSREAKSRLPVAHWSLFTTLADFTAPGDIEHFITEDSVAMLEQKMAKTGFLEGQDMGWSFRLLRSNGLVWNYVVNSYLYGQEPAPIDVLYWNTDNTRLPARMHSFYLREFYLNNKLCQPDALTINKRKIDLGKIRQPLYAIGTEQDHIAPWQETFKIASAVSGPVHYTLATSGHIMGIVNPPVEPPKRRYWTGDATGHKDPNIWRDGIKQLPGSWWEHWTAWLTEHCGEEITPPKTGSETHPVLCAAPGTYVLER